MNTVKKEIKNNIGYLLFNRDEKLNAFNAGMVHEITTVMNEFSANEQLRAVIIKAQGKVFSAGADLEYMKTMSEASSEENRDDSLKLFDMFLSIYNCPIPTLAIVRGASFGGANGVLASCDYAVATEPSTFSFSEVNVGLVPATIAPFVLQKIGQNYAMDLFVSGHRFHAETAKKIGLIDRIYDAESIENAALNVIKEISSSAPNAVRTTKKLVREIAPIQPAEYREKTAAIIAQARVSAEGQEGIAAFLEKRKPNW